jgi:hypothetical protein
MLVTLEWLVRHQPRSRDVDRTHPPLEQLNSTTLIYNSGKILIEYFKTPQARNCPVFCQLKLIPDVQA